METVLGLTMLRCGRLRSIHLGTQGSRLLGRPLSASRCPMRSAADHRRTSNCGDSTSTPAPSSSPCRTWSVLPIFDAPRHSPCRPGRCRQVSGSGQFRRFRPLMIRSFTSVCEPVPTPRRSRSRSPTS